MPLLLKLRCLHDANSAEPQSEKAQIHQGVDDGARQ
jgi:hypothetical protein